jgi:hypothetical protein
MAHGAEEVSQDADVADQAGFMVGEQPSCPEADSTGSTVSGQPWLVKHVVTNLLNG